MLAWCTPSLHHKSLKSLRHKTETRASFGTLKGGLQECQGLGPRWHWIFGWRLVWHACMHICVHAWMNESMRVCHLEIVQVAFGLDWSWHQSSRANALRPQSLQYRTMNCYPTLRDDALSPHNTELYCTAPHSTACYCVVVSYRVPSRLSAAGASGH